MSGPESIRFDDLDGLNAAATEEFGPWGDEVEVTQEMIDRFADLTGDRQWIHVDVERARAESPFGGPIAHGFLTLALLPRLRGVGVKVSGARSATNLGAESLRFLAPVPAGATLRGRSRLVRAEPWPKGGTVVTTELELRAVDAAKPALVYRMQVLYR